MNIRILGGSLVAVVSLCAHTARGDEYEKSCWQIGVHAAASLPQGAFKENLPEVRWGALGYFTRRYRETPIRFGLEVGAIVNNSVDLVSRDRMFYFAREAKLSKQIDICITCR